MELDYQTEIINFITWKSISSSWVCKKVITSLSQEKCYTQSANKFACSIKFVSLKLITFLNSMSCPTQKSFHEKISCFLQKMLSNLFGIHLSYLPSAHLCNFCKKLACGLADSYRIFIYCTYWFRKEYLVSSCLTLSGA